MALFPRNNKEPVQVMKPSKRFLAIAAIVSALALAAFFLLRPTPQPPIRIGVLHSLTGTMATSEMPLVDAVRLAIEEINAAGGLLGRPVEMVVADGKSDDKIFAAEAERLIATEKVSALFACWTSSCRKAVKPVVEKHHHLMFYPLQYEGLERSSNIYYLGSAPNQQIIPGTLWAFDMLGKRVYLLGSDYIFPRAANLIIKGLAKAGEANIMAERYLPLDAADFNAVIAELKALKPDIVLNTLNGDSNLHFFHALKEAGLGKLPVMSFSVEENLLQMLGKEAFHPEHYATWSYFMSQPGEANQHFVAAFKKRYGAERVTSDPMVAAYAGTVMWAHEVQDNQTDDTRVIRAALSDESLAAPSGILAMDIATRHLWKPARIGKVRADGQFEIVWESRELIRPDPFSELHQMAEWQGLLAGMPQ